MLSCVDIYQMAEVLFYISNSKQVSTTVEDVKQSVFMH